jgi:ribosomal protein S18 acetylase RimI-like enzyme
MGNDMVIRELTRDDLPSLLELYKQLFRDAPTEVTDELWEQIILQGGKIFAAVDGDVVAASCAVSLIPNIPHNGRPLGYIENVITHADYRRMGLGRQVMTRAVDYAKENNCYRVFLESGENRTEAHEFYQSLGFDSSAIKAFQIKL